MGKAADFAPPSASGLRVAIVAARYNEQIVEQLVDGAFAAWRAAEGADDALSIERVPGAFELPLAAKWLAHGGYSAIIALGAVIRGETPHFDFVAGEAARGLQQVALECNIPVDRKSVV